MRKLTGIFLVLLSAALVFISISALVQAPEAESRAAEAVWLGDDHLDPANEGKLVVMILDPHKLTNAEDPDLNISFQTPGVVRHVEKSVSSSPTPIRWDPLQEGQSAEGLSYKPF